MMSDNGAIGVIIHDLAETLSEKYYQTNGNDRVKSHLGFGLILLKDLTDIIQKENIDLDLDNLPSINFYMNEDAECEFIRKYLNGELL